MAYLIQCDTCGRGGNYTDDFWYDKQGNDLAFKFKPQLIIYGKEINDLCIDCYNIIIYCKNYVEETNEVSERLEFGL